MEKSRIKKLLFIIKKNKLNENRFYLQTKISIKKIRDRENIAKKIMRGAGGREVAVFLRDNFVGAIFQGHFSR